MGYSPKIEHAVTTYTSDGKNLNFLGGKAEVVQCPF